MYLLRVQYPEYKKNFKFFFKKDNLLKYAQIIWTDVSWKTYNWPIAKWNDAQRGQLLGKNK